MFNSSADVNNLSKEKNSTDVANQGFRGIPEIYFLYIIYDYSISNVYLIVVILLHKVSNGSKRT